MNEEPLSIARALGAALDAVSVAWAVGGSVASSVHGVPRSTADLDVIVAMPAAKVVGFAMAAGAEFTMDAEVLGEQMRQGRSYNVFHAPSLTKIDLFPAVGRFERNQLARSVLVDGVRVLAAELRWYRLGGEISDRQWRDISGMVSISGDRLDHAHLRGWAIELGVVDLLDRALLDTSGGL